MNDSWLKNCPFCGGIPMTIVEQYGLDHTVRIECSKCKSATPAIVYRPKSRTYVHRTLEIGWMPDLPGARDEAARIWNLRGGAAE